MSRDEVDEFRRSVVARHPAQNLAVEAEDECPLSLAEPHRVLGECLEDGLEIERGSADHLEQFAGRRLLLVRLADLSMRRGELFPNLCQLAVACLELLLRLRQPFL